MRAASSAVGAMKRPPDALEGFVSRLARAQPDVERARFEQRNVFGRALGVARLDRQRWVGLVDRVGKRAAVKREAAAGRRGAENDFGRHKSSLRMIFSENRCPLFGIMRS